MLLFRPLELPREYLATHGDLLLLSSPGRKYTLIGKPDIIKLLVNHVQWNLARDQSYLIQKELSPIRELIPGFLQRSDGSFHRTLYSTQYTPSKLESYTRSLLVKYTEFRDGVKNPRRVNLLDSVKEIVYKTVSTETFGLHLDSEQIKHLLESGDCH